MTRRLKDASYGGLQIDAYTGVEYRDMLEKIMGLTKYTQDEINQRRQARTRTRARTHACIYLNAHARKALL